MDWFLTALGARPYDGEMPFPSLEDLMAKLSDWANLFLLILLVVVCIFYLITVALAKTAILRLAFSFLIFCFSDFALIFQRIYAAPYPHLPPLGDFVIALICFNLIGVGILFGLASFLHIFLPEID